MKLLYKISRFKQIIKNIEKENAELLWAKVWDDTRRGIDWAENIQRISPGRWAVGYNYLYVMTRVLDNMKPDAVLDIGLGISSTLISSYFSANIKGTHTIIEQDKDWVEFYLKSNKLSSSSEISILQCVEKEYKNNKYYAYSGLKEIIDGRKYSVISVDAPWGSKHNSRRDIVEFLPDLLEEEFVIIMDDTNRPGELETVEEIKTVLKDNFIDYSVGSYSGETDCTIICSSGLKYFCTM